MPKWVADAKKKKKEQETVQKKAQSSSVSAGKARGTFAGGVGDYGKSKTTAPKKTLTTQERINQKTYGQTTKPTYKNNSRRDTTSPAQRKQNASDNMNLKQTQIRKSQEERQARKASAPTIAERQRQKMGYNSSLDPDQSKAVKRAVKNTPGLVKKAVLDTVQGHGQTIADITEVTASNENGTKAKAMKMGIDLNDKKQMDEVKRERQKTVEQAKLDREKWAKQQDERQQAWDKKVNGATGAEKAYYGAVESGTGMLTDLAIGLGTQGGSLAAMFSRTYGSTRGQAQKEGATEAEDRTYAFLQAAKEVGTELMFPGAGLAGRAYGKKAALPLAERLANNVTKRIASRTAADLTGAGVRLLGGTAEENLEEVAGFGLDPLIKEFSYGRNVRTRQKVADLQNESDQLRANIKSDEDARRVASYLSSSEWLDQNKQQYMEAGLSEKQAQEVAEKMRDYMTASLTGDTETMDMLEQDIASTLSKGEFSYTKSLDKSELLDTLASTTLLTLTTGLPGTATTAMRGSVIRDNLGEDGIRTLAESAMNYEDEEASKRGEVARDRLNAGQELTATQVYELAASQAQQVEKDTRRVVAKNAVVADTLESEKLVAPMIMRDEQGNIHGDSIITQRYNESAQEAENVLKDIGKDQKLSLSDSELAVGSRAIAGFQTGAFTINDANALNYTNTAVREAFEKVTGVDLGQYVVKTSSGAVDYAATNAATKDALFTMAADNFIETARAETENFKDITKGITAEQMAQRIGSEGDLAISTALDTVDPADEDTYGLMSSAAQNVYEYGRFTEDSWDDVSGRLSEMYPGLSQEALKDVYEAAKRDKTIAETPYYNAKVTANESVNKMDMSEAEQAEYGKFTNDPGEDIGKKERAVLESLAREFNINIRLLPSEFFEYKYVDRNGKEKTAYSNGSYDPKTGTMLLNGGNDMDRNLIAVALHETTHHIAIYAPEEYLALSNRVMETWYKNDVDAFNAAIKRKQDTYKAQVKQNLSEEQALEEVIADAMGEMASDPDFISQICTEEPTLAEQIIKAIKSVLRKLRAVLASGNVAEEYEDAFFNQIGIWDDAQRLWLQAAKVAQQQRANQMIDEWDARARETTKKAETRHSINDSDYMAAVERGDMETAQRMVDQAAREAGYEYRGYHGTNLPTLNENYEPTSQEDYANKILPYTIFKPGLSGGIYVATNKEYSEAISKGFTRQDGTVMGLYVKFKNPLIVNEHVFDSVPRYFAVPTPSVMKGDGYTQETLSTEEISEYAQKHGYDGVIIEGIREGGDIYTDDYIAFSSEQLKLADPVTYDDNGDVIPLSERFNEESPDIRYSISFNDKSFDELNDAEQSVIHEAVSPEIRFSMPTERDVLPKARYKSDIGFSNAISAISGKQARINALVKNGFSEKQAKQIGEAISNVILDTGNWIEGDLQSEFTFIGWDDLINAEVSVRKDWKDKVVGVSVSAMVANGEYPVNFDLTTICNKREGIMQVIQNLTRIKTDTGKSVLDSVKLTDQDMWNINKALKAEGIDTACLGCFVEARRYYTNRFIASIDNKWNTAVRETRRQLGLPEEEYFNFAHGKKVTGEDYTAISDLWTSYEKSKDTKKSPEQRIRILMNEIIKNKEVDSPYLKLVSASDILTPEGISGLKQISTGKHDLVKTLKSIYGTSAPKEILAFTPYNSEIALLPKNLKGQRTDKYLRSIGGIRIQSFSDFKIEHVIDHMQMVADMAARKFTCHAYSKVIAFPRIFGLTGQKINMSVMFDITPAEEWQKMLGCSEEKAKEYAFKYAGLRFVQEKPAENPDNRPYIETEIEGVHGYLTYLLGDADYINSVYEEEYQKNIAAGMDENEARRRANEAKPFEQSINYREAVELENQDGYKENVGIIAVAYGNEHLKILLADPNVRYVIPYHKSGLPVFVSEKTSLQYARNYEPVQNTKKADPAEKLHERYDAFKKDYKGDYPAIAFFGDIYDKGGSIATTEATATEAAKLHGTGEFDVYKDLDKAKDIKEVSNAYLEDCIENNLVPVFSEFAGDPNYYKMLFDFAVTDGTSDHIYPQKTVRNNYPGIDVDAKIAAGEKITEDDYAKLREAIRKGASEENAKNQTRSENMQNVLDDILSKDSENSILAGTNVNAIRDSATDYTDPKGIKHSITPEMDEAYMDAYWDGNDDAMQELVNEAANRAGYTYQAYHHTEYAFSVFDRSKARRSMDIQGFYFSADPEAEREYGSVRYDVFLKIENPYIVDSSEAMRALPFEFGTEDAGVRAREWLQENGYDAVIRDAEYYGSEADEIIVFEPEQIKSSEPMLFKDDESSEYGEGEIIPLSQRFDASNPDIRYSLPTQDSDGNILSDGQMEYFKNSQARDEQGRLMRVYHGTASGPRIRIFTGDTGFFFSDNVEVSEEYATKDDYDIPGSMLPEDRDPYESDEEYLTRMGFKFEEDDGEWIAKRTSYDGYGEYEYDDTADSKEELMEMILSSAEANDLEDSPFELRNTYSAYLNLINPYIIECNESTWDDINDTGMTTRDVVEEAMSEGYDGVIFKDIYDSYNLSNVYVAFSSSQIKDTRNTDPTNNPDIRYSITEEENNSRKDYDYASSDDYEWLEMYEDMLSDADAETEFVNATDENFNMERFMRMLEKYGKADKRARKTGRTAYVKLDNTEDLVNAFSSSLVEETSMVYDDDMLEEGRKRMATSKQDFWNNLNTKWNNNWISEGLELNVDSVKRDVKNLVMGIMDKSDTDKKYKSDLVKKTLMDMRLAFRLMKQDRTELASAILYHSALRMIENVDFIEDDSEYQNYKALREYLRKTKISFSEEYWSDVDFQAYRKRNFGRLKIVKGENNIYKGIYSELQRQWPDYFSEEEMRKQGNDKMGVPEMMSQLDYVLNLHVDPITIAYSSEECANWAFDIADDLYEIMANGDRIVSTADRYKEKYDAQARAMKTRHAEAILRIRKAKEEGIAAEKAKFKEYKEKQKEKKFHSKYFESIAKSHKTLSERLLTNTKDKHIPEVYKAQLAELLSAFDLQTVGSKKVESRRGVPGKKTIQMAALRTTLKNMAAKSELFYLNDSITDIMDELLGINSGGGYSRSIEGLTLDELDSTELKKIDKLLKALIHEFNYYESVRVGIKRQQAADIGSEQIKICLNHVEEQGEGKDWQNFLGHMDNILSLDEVTPAYMFRMIDRENTGIGTMFKELRRSFGRYVKNQEQLNEWMDEILGEYHNTGRAWNKYGSDTIDDWRLARSAKTFRLESGKDITLTPAQMMSIYCLSNRAQAVDHMTGAGVVVQPVTYRAKMETDLKRKANPAIPAQLTMTDIMNIKNQLTPDQKKVADKLQKLMANEMAEWGNEASMAVIGIRLFEDRDYFPIKSDEAALEKDFSADQFTEAIRNFGFAKAVQPGASNSIAIGDIFDVVAEHCNQMNLYNAYSEAMNDFMKVYNYHERQDTDTGYTDYSVEQAIAYAFSKKATTYIGTFMKDLNGNVSRDRMTGIESMMNDLLSKAKKTSVFANGRVALQQPTAIMRAFAVIDPKYIKGVSVTNATMREMFEHSPIALWKSWGYYDINMGKSVEDLMMNNGNWLEDQMTDLYGKLDNRTWAAIWGMCKAEIEDKYKDVKAGTDEYWELVSERFDEVVDLTQVVDSPFHRSHAMRSKNTLVKMATAFMAEPTLTFNMVRDGFIRSKEQLRLGNKANAGKIFGRTLSVFLLSAATTAAAAAIWDVVRGKDADSLLGKLLGADDDDDDDEGKLHRWWENFLANLQDNINLLNNIYYVKDIVSIFQGLDQRNLGLQGFKHIADGFRQLTGQKVSSSLSWWQNIASGFGYLSGYPVKTVMNDFNKVWDGVFGLFGLESPKPFAEQLEKLDEIGGSAKDMNRGGSSALVPSSGSAPSAQTSVKLWTYDNAPFKVEDGSPVDNFLNHFGVNLTSAEIAAAAEAEAEKERQKQIDKIKTSLSEYSGEEYDKHLWDKDVLEGYGKAIADGDFKKAEEIEQMFIDCGGSQKFLDDKKLYHYNKNYIKTITYDPTDEQIEQQTRMRDFLLSHGVTESELSAKVYKSNTCKELKVAFRLNDKDAILEELVPLIRAGITYDDFVKAYDNRNRVDLKKYKDSDGKYAERLKSTGVYNWPITGQITSNFGHRSSPGGIGSTNHQGLDIAGNMGDPVGAADGGTVVYAGWYGGAGKTVMIEHDDGTITQYSHLSWWDAKVGDTVAQGQTIGKVGSTGNSTGPHLHFGVKVNGSYVDPLTYLN